MSDDESLSKIEEQEKVFLAAPDGEALLKMYEVLQEELRDDLLAGILDKIRPIQHRITLIQANVHPMLLEALCRDPHLHVREVVATHSGITEEVCFRLCEDQQRPVRLALRKNPACHGVIRAALLLREKGTEEGRVKADHLLEISWQARRAELPVADLLKLIEDWVDLDTEELIEITGEQATKVLEVLDAKLGRRPMPRKPRKKKKKRKPKPPKPKPKPLPKPKKAAKKSGKKKKKKTRSKR